MNTNGARYRCGRRARSLRAGAGLLVGGWLVALVLPATAATVTVPAGTRVPLQIDQRLDSRRTRPGERVRLRARSAVTVRGHRVIARGARAEAYVDRVRQPGR